MHHILTLTCFETKFPRVLGGTLSAATTSFESTDKDSAGNIVIGGSTSDSSLANLYNSPDPFVLYIQYGNTYLWGINFAGYNLKSVGAVRFSSTGVYIFAGLS